MNRKKNLLLDWNQVEFSAWIKELGEPEYRAMQVFSWIFQKRVYDFSEMSNIPKKLREKLDRHFQILPGEIIQKLHSTDGSVKYVFKLTDGALIESVYMPFEEYYTVCLSSQAGCALGCKFCATGKSGIQRNLSAAEISYQLLAIQDDVNTALRATAVFMGMGEPLLNFANLKIAIEGMTSDWGLNWAAKRITVSTAGIVPEIIRLSQSGLGVNLAVSLNAADDQTRSRIMPINKMYPLKLLLQTLKEFPLKSNQDRITIEYVMIKGLNDTEASAKKLKKMLDKRRYKVNLILYNPIDQSRYKSPDLNQVAQFQKILSDEGIIVRIRQSRGSDIAGACGQLAGNLRESENQFNLKENVE